MNLIFSADNNWGIGLDNKLLFRAKGDMARFRQMTLGKVVIMGRSTLESLPKSKPLPDRVNIVLTSDEGYFVDNAVICHSLEELFESVKAYEDEYLFVIGGEKVYRQLMPYCGTAYVTRFFADSKADRFMPDFDSLSGWKMSGQSERQCEDSLCYSFFTYVQEAPEKWRK